MSQAKDQTHESGQGYLNTLPTLWQTGLKIILLIIPLATACGGWAVNRLVDHETRIVVLEKDSKLVLESANHMDVIEERIEQGNKQTTIQLNAIVEALRLIRDDVKDLRSRQ